MVQIPSPQCGITHDEEDQEKGFNPVSLKKSEMTTLGGSNIAAQHS